MKYDKNTMNSLQEAYKSVSEEKVSKDHPNHPDKHDDHPDMTYKDAAKIRGEKKIAKKQVE